MRGWIVLGLVALLAGCAEPTRRDPAGDDRIYAAMLRGRDAQLAGDLDSAEVAFREVLADDPTAARARLRLAQVLGATGRADDAAVELARAWRDAPGALREPCFDAACEIGLAELAGAFAAALPGLAPEALEPVAIALAHRGAWAALEPLLTRSALRARLASWATRAWARGEPDPATELVERMAWHTGPRELDLAVGELRFRQGCPREAIARWRTATAAGAVGLEARIAEAERALDRSP